MKKVNITFLIKTSVFFKGYSCKLKLNVILNIIFNQYRCYQPASKNENITEFEVVIFLPRNPGPLVNRLKITHFFMAYLDCYKLTVQTDKEAIEHLLYSISRNNSCSLLQHMYIY